MHSSPCPNLYIDVSIEAAACAHSADTIRYATPSVTSTHVVLRRGVTMPMPVVQWRGVYLAVDMVGLWRRLCQLQLPTHHHHHHHHHQRSRSRRLTSMRVTRSCRSCRGRRPPPRTCRTGREATRWVLARPGRRRGARRRARRRRDGRRAAAATPSDRAASTSPSSTLSPTVSATSHGFTARSDTAEGSVFGAVSLWFLGEPFALYYGTVVSK